MSKILKLLVRLYAAMSLKMGQKVKKIKQAYTDRRIARTIERLQQDALARHATQKAYRNGTLRSPSIWEDLRSFFWLR